MYDPETDMVLDAHFLHLNVNNLYNHNINLVEFSNQLLNVYQLDHWMRKYKWWWYLLFWFLDLILVIAYIIYKTLFEEVKVNPINHY